MTPGKLQAARFRSKASLHQQSCLKRAERIAERDNAGPKDWYSQDNEPGLGKVQIDTGGTSYYLEYEPEAAKPPAWKFWKQVEPHFEHGDVKHFMNSTSWEGVTIETRDDKSVSYEDKQLTLIGDEWFYHTENTVVDSAGEPLSYEYREKALGDFRGGPIPDFEAGDAHQKYIFSA